MKNYIYLNGKKIELSEESAKAILEAQEPKKLTYEDVAKELFSGEKSYYFNGWGDINVDTNTLEEECSQNSLSKTKEQLEAILALNKLCNVAKYLNGDWKPNFADYGEGKYFLVNGHLGIAWEVTVQGSNARTSLVYFKSEALAQQAISILGEEEIKKALTLNV